MMGWQLACQLALFILQVVLINFEITLASCHGIL